MMKIRSGGVLKLLAIMLTIVSGCVVSKTMPTSQPESRPVMTLPAPEPEPERNGLPKKQHIVTIWHHVWGPLVSYGIEQKDYPGYAVYTYVLFNSNQPDAESPEGKRYDGILQAVLQEVTHQETGAFAGWPKDKTNIFCIPFVTFSPKKVNALQKYDFELSKKYLAVLQGTVNKDMDIFKRLKQRTGPFLISLYEPLPRLQGKDITKMLYLDLTDMPQEGMRQVLDTYKQRLDAEPLKNVEKLRDSLKIILMKYALILDENLKIVDVAFARFKDSSSP